jgi:predicted phage terminase large subunit-like protein
VEQEGGSGGKESAEATINNCAGYVVKRDLPKGEKSIRADPLSVQVNNGNVVVVQAGWNQEFKEELEYFPESKNKDQVDAGSAAFAKLTTRKKIGPLR